MDRYARQITADSCSVRSRPRGIKWRALAAIAAGAALAATATPTSAQPSSCSSFGDRIVGPGEVLDCSVNVIGGSLVVEPGAEVAGSVNVPFGNAIVRGVVGGDVYAGGDVAVEGNVGGTVFATGDVTVMGTAGGDVAANGDIEVTGRVAGNVESVGGGAAIRGAVDGEVRAAGDIELAATAVVAGATHAGGDVVRAAGAQVLNQSVVDATAPVRPRWTRAAVRTLLALSMVLFAALFGALTTAVAPGAVRNLRRAAGGSARLSVATGVAAVVIALPLVAMLVVPTLVMPALWGIMGPLIAIVAGIYVAALFVGAVGAGNLIGAKLLAGRAATTQSAVGAGLLALVAAFGIFFGIRAWPQLCFTAGVALLAQSWLSGASWLTLFGRRPWPPLSDAPDGVQMDAGSADPSEAGAAAPVGMWDEPTPGTPPGDPDMPGIPSADEPAPTPDTGTPSTGLGPDAGPPLVLHVPDVDATTPDASTGVDPAAALAELRRIPGVTPIYARLLIQAGIAGLADLAAASPDAVAQAVAAPGVLGIEREAAGQWIDHARRLVG